MGQKLHINWKIVIFSENSNSIIKFQIVYSTSELKFQFFSKGYNFTLNFLIMIIIII